MISFGKKNIKQYEHLMKQKNASQYVADLIEKDMENGEINNLYSIKQALREVLDEYEFGIVASRKEDNDLDYSEKIDDLFNI